MRYEEPSIKIVIIEDDVVAGLSLGDIGGEAGEKF